jgi:heme/copper-type cytochrome/quinol oxidase subunit 2
MFTLSPDGQPIRMQPQVQQMMNAVRTRVNATAAPSKKKWYKQWYMIVLYVIVAILIIAAVAMMLMKHRKSQAQPASSFGFYF